MSLLWYMGASSTLKKHKDLLEKMKAESNFASPLRLSEITEADLDKYAGVFIPGGHAPLEVCCREAPI